MKQIQILALVVALAFTAAAQSTSTPNNQSSGSTSPSKSTAKATPGKPAQNGVASTQTPPVQLKVKNTQPATKNASSATGSKAKSTTAGKTGAQTSASKTTASKTPAVVIKPVQTSTTGKPASSTSTANAKKTDVTKAKKTDATASKKPVVTTATKPVVTTAAKPVVTAPKKSVAGKAVTPKKPVAAKKKDEVKVVAKKAGADSKKTDPKTAETIKSGPAGRRDPFVSVIRNAPMSPAGPSCSVGKKCLYIPELVVKGIAKDPDGQMLAVVVSNTHRAYFLRENDQVFNGSVEKITTDSVVFREYATDHLGRETAHEVVKRIPKT